MTKTTTLDNGLRIVTQDMPGLETVAMGIWNSVGGRDELGMSSRASVGGGASAGAPDPRQLATNRGEQEARKPIKVDKQPGRNDPCPCGSGKKYKKCHGR